MAAATAHTAAGSAGPGLDASACPDDCSGNGVCFSGSCVCNAGYGGESCALSLATLGRRGEGAAGAGEGARTIDLDALAFGEAGGDAPVGALAFDPLGGGGAAEPAQAEEAVVPPHLKNMLLYAEHLSASGVTHFSAMEQSRRALLGADEDEFVSCGFYDVFYEGCSACFYSDVPCEAEPAFYDFYDGFIPHPPTVEYSESFADASAFGARANATDVVWGGPFAAATTPKGDAYLGGLSSADALTMAIGDLPASSAKVTLSLDVIVTEDALDGFSMQVLGAGAAVAPDSMLKMPTYLLGSPHYQVTFTVDYAATDMKVKFLAAVDGGATWGIDNLEVTSLVADHDPVVESRVVMATPDTATTIELRGSDAKCQNTTFTVTSLPTEGTLYLCTCDDIWTTAITAEMLPAVVPGPCQRVVYAPTPNAPASGFDLASTFDTFGFRAAAGARVSRPGTVDIYMTSTDAVPTPVAGIASFAAAFDGQDDVVSISETPSTLAALGTAFSVEARFRVIGDAGEATLVARAGAYRLGWTKTTGLTFTVHTAGGAREAAANLAFADGAYHYVAAVYTGTKVCLFVDGALAAEAAFPAVVAVAETTTGILLGGGTEKGGSAFRGVLDEFRAWTVALAPAAVAGFHRGAPPAPAAAGLLCYIPFKDGAAASPYAYDLTAHRNDAQLGVLGADGMTTGVVAEMPTFVASRAVFGNVFETAEDEPLEIQLHGGDADGGVTFVIATLSTKGFLYADGANVTHTPFELHGTSVVEYVPDYNANGAPMDIFKYQAYNGVEFSYRQGVVINVIPVNDAPTASDVAVTFDSDAMADGIKAVRLLASDVEGDALAFVITGLPERGSLFQAASVSPPVPGAEITALGTEVADADGYVLFVPLANGHDSAAGAYDSFKFVASDGQARSAEGVATVNVADDGIVQPVAGNAGYALLFDGSGTEATLGALKDYGVAGDFSLSLWFKTYASGDMVLLAAAPFTLEFTKDHGLQFSMAGSTVTHSLKYNDGSWHNVVASYSAAGGVCLLVDAGAKACGPADGAPAYDSALVLGKGPESHFLGQVDEVAVFDYEVAASFGYLDLASRDLASPSYVLGGVQVDVAKARHVAHPPVAYFKFNEATGAVVYEEFTAATGSLGDGAVPATQPSWIQSTMPIPDYVKVDEGMNVTLDLAVASEDGLTYGACIITQPAHGQLYYIGPDGAPAHALPQTSQPVSLGGTKVVYNSGDGAYGAGAGSFKYFGGDCDMYFYGVGLFYMDGEENAVHKSKTVDFVVDVQHVNHAPTACAGSVCAGVDLPYSIVEPVLLALEGEDLDGDNLTVALVHVPEHGALTDADGAVLEAGSTTSDSVLYYLPHVDATGADVDKVVYTISDGNFVTEPSALAISITDSAAGARPVAGESGYALSFDGDADYAELGTAAALGVAAGFQVGFFLKAREYAPGATVLALDGISLHWTAAEGLVLATGGGATAVSGLFLNDGQWHHVLVSVGAAGASLIVDGAAFEAAGLGAAPAFNASLPLTLGAAAETDGTGFQGLIDEVSVWDTSVAAADVISLAGSGYPLPVRTAGVKAYYRLNEAGGAALACAVAACADGTLPAAVASQPARATSNLGLMSPTVEVAEGASVSVTLPALSESDGMYLRLNATSKGATLENAKGKALKAGSRFTGPLTFVSALGKTGLFTVTYYAVNLAGESTAAEFSFNVTRANLVPEVDDVAAAVDFTDASNVELVLSGYDPNGDALTYVVESLPEFGVLYAAVDAHGVGEVRVAISQALTGTSLYYFPQLNADATSDAFSYTATDGELTSTVGTVTLTAGAAVTEVAPAAGQAGFALEFDGADDIVTLGTLADYSVAGTLELSAFFKTHGSVSGDMVLLEAGDLTVGFSAALGLYFKAGADLLPSFLPCNDGAWHSVAAVYSPGLLSLAVDGELATAPAAAAVDLAGTSVVYVGNSAAAQSHMGFNGAVDDVAVGNGASVTGLFYFNEKDGNALANEVAGGAAGVLGRAGAGSPTRVVSTMPSTVFTVTVAEDAEATFDLVGQVLDTDATAVFVVTRLPAGGTLYSVSASGKEKEVKSVPTALPGARVVFVPAENAHAAAGASSLTYVTENSANADYKSFPSTVHIEVTPVYERPTVSTPAAVTTERNTPVVVSFASADGDTAAAQLVHTLTSLPTVGKLLYADGRPVTEAPATIPADSLAMTYIPPPNAVGSPLVTLGFSVTDGNLTSEEGSVAVNVVGGSPAVFTDVTTEDYALPVVLKGLAFDGIDDVVASSLALKPRTSYALAAAFKTAAFTGEDMALVDFGSTVVGWNKVEGLFVAVGDARDASFEMFNDGLWHSVELNIDYQLPWNGVAAFGTYAVSVSVDGTTVASLADLAIAGPAGDGFTLGKAAGLKHFSGAIDEVTVLEAGVKVVHYSMDETSSALVPDTSGHGNHATMAGVAVATDVVYIHSFQNGFEGEYQAQELTVAEDGALTFDFVVTDGAIDSLAFQLVALPTHGKLYSGAGAAELAGQPVYHPITDSFLRYEPHPDFVGEDKLVYKVADPIGNGTLAELGALEVKFTVTPSNDPPTLAPAASTTGKGVAVVLDLATGSDIDSTALAYTVSSLPVHGVLYEHDPAAPNGLGAALAAPGPTSGAVVYVPEPGFVGADRVGVRVSDGEFTSDEALATVTVTGDGAIAATGPAGFALALDGAAVKFPLQQEDVSDFTAEFWVKTAAAVSQELPVFSVGNVEVTLAMFGMVKLGVDGEATFSPTAVNNGQWNHLAVVADQNAVTLYLNGAQALTRARGNAAINEDGQGDEVTLGAFTGTVDEVRVWSTPKTPAALAAAMHSHVPCRAGTVGLVGCLDFNSAADLGKYNLVVSTAPITVFDAATDEDVAVNFELLGPAGDGFLITSLPAKGSLTVGGVPITTVPYSLPQRLLTFAPVPNEYGAGYAEVGYVTKIGSTFSAEAFASISVASVNDPPTALPVAPVAAAPGAAVKVELQATDIDTAHGQVAFSISHMPLYGWLYQAGADGAIDLASPIADDGAAAVTAVSADGDTFTATVFYVPEDYLFTKPPTFQYDAKFVFAASDGEASAEAEVTVGIDQSPVSGTTAAPVKLSLPKSLGISTVAGQAIVFDSTYAIAGRACGASLG